MESDGVELALASGALSLSVFEENFEGT